MRLNPHGDQAIYETMVRLAKGNESLLTPLWTARATSARSYSSDMAYAASRYTEAKLAPICAELFRDLDCDAVDFVDNYDNTTKEPTLLPTTYPNVLVSANQGIAVGMASQICGFNLAEVCDTTIALAEKSRLRPDVDPAGAGFSHRRTAGVRPEHGGNLPHGPGRRQGSGPLALRQEGESHRDLRDPLLHLQSR